MATCKYKYLLVEPSNFSSVLSPLKSTQRIKYTCFEVSHSYIIFGATSGGLYIFKREPCHFLDLVPNKEGSINNISVSPDEKLIAFTTTRGIACVLEYHEGCVRLVNRSLEHCGTNITALTWGDTANQLFVADNTGQLSVVNVSLFMSKNIFQLPAYVFMKLDSSIVQVCCRGDILLVSTQTRCYICDTAKEQYKQIGSKPREGNYGGCFLGSCSDNLKVFCARPGSRLWEVDIDGTVVSTHQFKRALAAQPIPLVSLESNTLLTCSQTTWPEQSLNFSHLTAIMNKYIFSFKSDGIYIFDPEKVDVVLWSNHYKDICDAKCINDTVYIWTSKGELHGLVVTPIDKCLLRLYFREYYQLCVDICEKFLDTIMCPEELNKLSPLTGLREHFSQFSSSDKLDIFLQKLMQHVNCTQASARLDSGIFLVENRHLKWKLTEEEPSTTNSEDSRSQSLPPETSSSKELKPKNCVKHNNFCSSSSSSLPDLNNYSESVRHEEAQPEDSSLKVDPPVLNGKHPYTVTAAYEEYMFPQVPFFAFTTPDVIHNAIVELGHNVSGKLYHGTKTLRNKWQVLEGKFSFFKSDNYEQVDETNLDKSEIESESSPASPEEEIVAGKKRSPKKINQHPLIDVSQLLEICEEFEKLENGKKADIIASVLESVIKANGEFNKCLVNESKNSPKKVFPFSQCLNMKNILVIQKIFHDALKSGKIVKYLQKEQSSFVGSAVPHPEFLKKIYSDSDLKLDCVLSNLIHLFSEILDPFSILGCLHSSGLPCTYVSWSVIFETFQESAFNYITGTIDSSVSYTDWPLPLLLNTIFLMFRLDQVECSSVMAVEGRVKLRDISYILLKLSAHLESTGLSKEQCQDECNRLFLNFLLKLVDKEAITEEDITDGEVLKHFEEALMDPISRVVSICECGYPFVQEMKLNEQYTELGKLLINYYLHFYEVSNTDEEGEPKTNGISEENSEDSKHDAEHNSMPIKYLKLYPSDSEVAIKPYKISKLIKLLKSIPQLIFWVIQKLSCDVFDFIPFIVQFGQVTELDKFVESSSFEFWEQVCEQCVKLASGECCICSTKLPTPGIETSWNRLSFMLLAALGPLDALKLLLKYSSHIAPGKLDISFYRACLLSGLIYSETSGFNSSLVEAYRKTITRQPISGQNPEDPHSLTWEADSTDGQAPEIVYSKDRRNWGITLDLDMDVCTRCSLTLNSEKLIQEGGLRAFKCGHAFHVVCLRLSQSLFHCPVCP